MNPPSCSRRFPLWSRLASLLLGAAVEGIRLAAQPALDPLVQAWQTDGPVNAVTQVGNNVYLGGTFTYVGPVNGAFGLAQAADGARGDAVPRVEGTVNAILPDGAGGYYVGGTFTEASSGLANLIHILPGRVVDVGFVPNPNGTVRALVRRGNNLYVGGEFTTIGGSSGTVRRYLAALDPATGRTNSWGVSVNNEVYALALSPDSLYVGGLFSSLGGQTRVRVGEVNLATGTATTWNPGTSTTSGHLVNTMVLSPDGSLLYIGGNFTTAGGKPRNRIAALATAVDTNSGTDWNPNSNGEVKALALIGGNVYAAGSFTSIGSLSKTNVAAISASSGLAIAQFAPPVPSGIIESMVASNDALYVGGPFTTWSGTIRRGLARLDPVTGALLPWNALVSALNTSVPTVAALALHGNQLAFGGSFRSHNGVNRERLAAVDVVTGEATAWNPGANRDVLALTAGPTGILYAGGLFTQAGGAARNRVAALNPTDGGALPVVADVTASSNNGVNALLVVNNELVIGGLFTAVNGTNRANLAVVSADTGSLKASFTPNPNAVVRALAASGTLLLVGGEFTTIGGSNRVSLAALPLASGRATAFNARINSAGFVRGLSVANGILYVIGDFSSIGGQSRRKLAALDLQTGDAQVTWNPDVGVADSVRTYAIATSSRTAYLGGNFISAGGLFRNYLAGIPFNSNTANPWIGGLATGSGLEVRAMHYSGTHLIVGGEFTTVNGRIQQNLAIYPAVPTLPRPGISLNPDGNARITVFDGDGLGTQVELQASPNLGPGTWNTLRTEAITGSGFVFVDPATGSNPERWFRAVAKP